jgi:hypothetical protein
MIEKLASIGSIIRIVFRYMGLFRVRGYTLAPEPFLVSALSWCQYFSGVRVFSGARAFSCQHFF